LRARPIEPVVLAAAVRTCRSTAHDRLTGGSSDATFDDLLQQRLNARVEPEARRALKVTANARNRALAAARAGKRRVAETALRESGQAAGLAQLHDEALLVHSSFDAATAAYLVFRAEGAPAARRLLDRALLVDARLEREFGYDILHLHRLQIGHNCVRLAAADGRLEEAAGLAAALLAYMEGSARSLPLPGGWDPERLSRLPGALVDAMATQVMTEVASFLARERGLRSRRLLMPFRCHAEPATCAAGDRFAIVHDWLALQFCGDDAAILVAATRLLSRSPRPAPALWLTAALELLAVCDRHDPASGSALRADLDSVLDRWPRLPRGLQQAWDSSRRSPAAPQARQLEAP
jgi:hypothetical protein